jgi:maleylpyruvate isomerase
LARARSTSFRVRIALNLKRIAYEYVAVNLRWKDGDHDVPEYRAFNPQANIPVLVNGDVKVTQSLAIFAYLEALQPEPPLLPPMGAARSHVLSLAQHVACEIQPLNNLRVERYLTNTLQLGDELQLSSHPATGVFCYGDAPTVADCFLVPQVYSALRPGVSVDLADWPTMHRIYQTCMSLPAFESALPRHQPDFEQINYH